MRTQPLDRDRITKLVSTIFSEDLHAKRVASLAGAAVGVLEGAALGIHAIGNALAVAEWLKGKHAVKQVDRLLSNASIHVWDLFSNWVPYIVGDRSEVVTALDWTDFDSDDQSTIWSRSRLVESTRLWGEDSGRKCRKLKSCGVVTIGTTTFGTPSATG